MVKYRFGTFRPVRAGLATAALLVISSGVYLQPAMASNPDIKQYTTSVAPASVGAGSSATYTLTISNLPSSPQSLGSVNLNAATNATTSAHFSFLKPTPASGFPQALAQPLRDGTTPVGSATLRNTGLIEMRNLSLAPGHYVTVSFRAEAPCVGSGLSYSWTALIKQSNDFNGPPGNNYNLVGSAAATTVTGVCHLAFSAAPLSTNVGDPISDALFSTGGPVRVAVMSQTAASTPASTLVTFSSASVTMSASDVLGGALALQGTTTRSAVSGVASFANLSIDDGNHRLFLHAAPTSATADGIAAAGVNSGVFDVTNANADCAHPKPTGPSCTGGVPDSNGTTKALVKTDATSGFLAVTLDVQFSSLTVCPGSDYVLPPSDGVTYDVYGGSGALTLEYTVLQPDRPASQFEMCYASTAAFNTPSGPAGTLTDESGDTYFIGLLLPCKSAPAPCFVGPSTSGSKDKTVTLTAQLPAEGDRWTH